MKRKHTLTSAAICTALLSLGAIALPASAAVTVTFVHPESYRDLPFAPIERDHVLKDLGEYFVKLEKSLPAGQDLAIEVLDLDMAGRMLPSVRSAGQDLRVMHGGADWPHMKLRYTLSANGKVISSGQEQLSDMGYMDRINIYSSGDNLRYEKRMVDDWFKKKFVAPKHG